MRIKILEVLKTSAWRGSSEGLIIDVNWMEPSYTEGYVVDGSVEVNNGHPIFKYGTVDPEGCWFFCNNVTAWEVLGDR